MKLKQIGAVILMLIAISALGSSIIWLLTESRISSRDIFDVMLISIPSVLALFLIKSERLYSKSEADIVEQQNKVLKLKIE